MNRSTRALTALILGFVAATAFADPGTAFSSLPAEKQQQIRASVAPPPLAERVGPYSTPMYYLMYAGYKYEGDADKDGAKRRYKTTAGKPGPDYGSWTLDTNKPHWQEAMVRNWSELGMNNTHLNIYPQNKSLAILPEWRQAIQDHVRLSKKYGMKVGVRLDALGGPKAWEMNPNNPANQTEPYLVWVRDVATMLKGQAAYYVLGDELTLHESKPGLKPEQWTPEAYLEYFKKVSGVIREVDADVPISMFAASSGEWFNVLYLLKHGYAKYGNAVAINHYDYKAAPKFFADAAALAPGLSFLSNGVGYVSLGTVEPRYPQGDPYSKLPSEEAHGNEVAKHMFAWWDLGASTAPYYVSLRNWVVDGKVYPRWYGFFGFEDFVIDTKKDELTVKRYPAWHAYRTVAQTFYNRKDFKKPSFDVSTSAELSMFRAYEHQTDKGSELVLMFWNNAKEPVQTTIKIGSGDYLYPVQVSTFDHEKWTDLPYEASSEVVSIDVTATKEPTIIRLVKDPK
jgi:hypothetical protein